MPIGRNFLKLAPIEENTAGEDLDRRNGDGYMVITQADSLKSQQQVRQNALDNGVRVAHETSERLNLASYIRETSRPRSSKLSRTHITIGHWHPVGGLGWEDKVKQDITVDYLVEPPRSSRTR